MDGGPRARSDLAAAGASERLATGMRYLKKGTERVQSGRERDREREKGRRRDTGLLEVAAGGRLLPEATTRRR